MHRVEPLPAASPVLAPVFAAALFTSAILLFWVQPLIAKTLLPLLGGAPAVWNTCMVFFQGLLLGGYGYALLLSEKLSKGTQAVLHIALLVIAAAVLPFSFSSRILSALPTQSSPIPWVLGALLVTVGPPFFLLSATAPLLQRWFSHTTHKSAQDPYFLYALSNGGSMLGLLAFPFLLEPLITVRRQSWIWAIAYAGLVFLMVGCALLLRRNSRADSKEVNVSTTQSVSVGQKAFWVLLAFIPSSLMLGVTAHITTDVATVPLLWIIPLALYLLTFMLAFSRRQLMPLRLASQLFLFSVVGLTALKIVMLPLPVWMILSEHFVLFFLGAFVCHTRLAMSRPSVTRLPEYYLWIATGGVLGGMFNALLAPVVFPMPWEYPIVVVLACMVTLPLRKSASTPRWLIAFPSILLVTTMLLSVFVPRLHLTPRLQDRLVLLLPLLLCYGVTFRRPVLFGLSLIALIIGTYPYLNASVQILAAKRNFFGIWRVTTIPREGFRVLYHGNTIHGLQFNDESRKCLATSYYHRDGPLGQIFDLYNSQKKSSQVAAVGLGSGTIGTYSLQGQQWDIYDIDPDIVRLATDARYFRFLSDCTAAQYRFVMGDARLQLARAADDSYGLIVMDAFSSDSVPVHLLTKEALHLYLTKLTPDGLLAFHISNRYLNLEPLLAGLARDAHLVGLVRKDEGNPPERYTSIWVVLARNDSDLQTIVSDGRWRRVEGNVLWTDEFSNLLSVLR